MRINDEDIIKKKNEMDQEIKNLPPTEPNQSNNKNSVKKIKPLNKKNSSWVWEYFTHNHY
jgi:hypothetical protein